jgi:N-acetylglutamate synthase-like GNAT family acetyltransferase
MTTEMRNLLTHHTQISGVICKKRIYRMVYIPSGLPAGFRIRQLQLNHRDRLSLYFMPRNPHNILPFVPINLLLIFGRVKEFVIPWSSVLLFYILVNILLSYLPVRLIKPNTWLWLLISWLVFLGIGVGIILSKGEEWLRFCWVIEHEERFIAYGALQPYHNYSILKRLQVHPQWSRKGFGSTLVRMMIESAPKPVYVNSADRVVGFYTRLGFRRIRFQELPLDVQKHFNFEGVATLLVYE